MPALSARLHLSLPQAAAVGGRGNSSLEQLLGVLSLPALPKVSESGSTKVGQLFSVTRLLMW